MALLGICDASGAFASAHCREGDAALAARAARSRVRPGFVLTQPDLAIVTCCPGVDCTAELARLGEEIGRDVPVVGGGAADALGELDASQMWVAGDTCVETSGVQVTLCWLSVRTRLVLSSCYEPVGRSTNGVCTAVSERNDELLCIDGRPAQDVYREWLACDATKEETCALATAFDEPKPASVLRSSTLRPLARTTATDRKVLLHPSRLTVNGGLELFAPVAVGDELCLMRAERADLVTLLSSARDTDADNDTIAGALVVYCGGCALAVGKAQLGTATKHLATALGRKPFCALFAYGELGHASGANVHANLMYSVVLFGTAKHNHFNAA